LELLDSDDREETELLLEEEETEEDETELDEELDTEEEDELEEELWELDDWELDELDDCEELEFELEEESATPAKFSCHSPCTSGSTGTSVLISAPGNSSLALARAAGAASSAVRPSTGISQVKVQSSRLMRG
jgi:hypothetical protein